MLRCISSFIHESCQVCDPWQRNEFWADQLVYRSGFGIGEYELLFNGDGQ
jgi:hypothetical protein